MYVLASYVFDRSVGCYLFLCNSLNATEITSMKQMVSSGSAWPGERVDTMNWENQQSHRWVGGDYFDPSKKLPDGESFHLVCRPSITCHRKQTTLESFSHLLFQQFHRLLESLAPYCQRLLYCLERSIYFPDRALHGIKGGFQIF